MRGKRPAQVEVAGHVLNVPQPDGGLEIHKQHPEHYCGGADALVGVPDVLHPDVGAGREKQPVHRYEEETEHVAGQRHAHEEHGERQTLVLERVVDGAQQQVERP